MAEVPKNTRLPILYSSVRSPHCLKVSMVLHEKGIDFERVEIDLPARAQRTPEFLAINPLGQVPVYVDEHGTHIDSLVIMKHVDRVHPEPWLFPESPAALAEVERWIARSSGPMRDVSHHLYWQLIEPPEGGPDVEMVAKLKAQGLNELGDVESALERSTAGWLCGSLSAADVAVFAWLSGYHRFGLPRDPESVPLTMAWLERIRRRPSFVASHGHVGEPFMSSQP